MAIEKRSTAGSKGTTAPISAYKAMLVATDTPPICLLWGYRLLTQQRLYRQLHNLLESQQHISDKLGLDVRANELTIHQLQQLTNLRLKELEQQRTPALPATLASNMADLTSMIQLNQCEQRVLAFAVLLKTDPLLQAMAELLPPLGKQSLFVLLAQVLAVPQIQVNDCFKINSALTSSGLLTLPATSNFMLDEAFEFVVSYFEHQLIAEMTGPAQLLKNILQPANAPTLTLSQYPHLITDLQITMPYLKTALRHKTAGVNILLYGPPGTGKSELARVLAQKLNTPLFDVSSEDDDGDAISGPNRLRAYRLAQRCLSSSQNLLLFDEIEDVFTSNPLSRHGDIRKGWMNRMLEQNPVPCFWISNDISEMDGAFIRRFDQVIALDTPPRAQRAEQLYQAAATMISQDEAFSMTEHPALTPAIISRAAKVVTHLHHNLKRDTKKAALNHLMQQTLQAQGYAIAETNTALGPVYDATLINADVDLALIPQGLQQAGSARLCLYGPPGTGKTAYCHYLAKTLQLPLLTKSASELLGSYVGETEQKIAAAFAQAKQDKAILLLDEVDSFLQDRQKARQSWEITAVNEMLVQMESFNGIFVASTNLMHNLDQASLRRFDVKICFNYLTAAQSEQLFHRYCKTLKLKICHHSAALLKQNKVLTPGDYAAIARQSRFRAFTNANEFAKALLKEVALKNASMAKQIGFLQ